MANLVFYETRILDISNEPPFRYNRILNALRHHPAPQIIPKRIIDELLQLYREGFTCSALLADILIHRDTELKADLALSFLRDLANVDKNAAFQCALCYMAMGKFPQPKSNYLALHYLSQAILLGHDRGFLTFLDAICDGNLVVTGEEFVPLCRKFLLKTKNYDIALCIGSLLCGFQIEGHPELQSLGLKDTTAGYAYLRYAFNHGNEQQQVNALNILMTCMQRGIFKNESALIFQRELEELFHINLCSTSCHPAIT